MADYGRRKVNWQKIDADITKKPDPKRKSYERGRRNREKFIELLGEHDFVVKDAIAAHPDWERGAYEMSRKRWPEFAARVDALRGVKSQGYEFTGDFADFRKEFFGFDTPWFQRMIVDILQGEETQGGSITMVLLPPEHGKTSLLEDWDCFALAMDPNFSITVGSERQEMARKILRRVRHRMEPEGPTPEFVSRFGPFAPQRDARGRHSHQPWGADFFDVYNKLAHDEREYSMQGLGITSQIAGTRTHLLQADDITSLKNYNQTEKVVEVFRQDWLSRPGVTGRTVILGTRVGEMDFYETLEVEGLVDHLIKIPAQNDEGEWLWPERYSEDDYERLRRNVGEDAWWRNYMQKPRAAGDATFTEEGIERSLYQMLSLDDAVEPGWPIYIGVDPALGGTCAITAWQHQGVNLTLVAAKTIQGLSRAEQIMSMIEAMCLSLNNTKEGAFVTDVIIEINAYQKGLANDDRLMELSDRYGFSILPHITGKNKHDELIGLAQMERSMRSRNVKLPYAADERTRAAVDPLLQEMRSWRPDKRGNRLRQDLLMSMWFVWILWRNRQTFRDPDLADEWKTDGLHSVVLGAGYKDFTSQYRPLLT